MEKSCPGPKLRDGEFETMTRSSTPSKLNAWPARPLVKPTPLSKVALLELATSEPSFSARHQLIRFVGSVAHPGTTTVRIASALVAVPRPLLTVTAYGPAADNWTFVRVN